MSRRIVVVGGGIFGITAAVELRTRGFAVAVFDTGPIPRPEAASTDVSKVVRMEYGSDETYMGLMEEALRGWRTWNAELRAGGRAPLFHETGVLLMAQSPLRPGGFEHDSLATLRRRGHAPEPIDSEAISRRYPAWRPGAFAAGFYHAAGGYAESGPVVAWLADRARAQGVDLHAGEGVQAVMEAGGRIRGVRTSAGRSVPADAVVVAGGAWGPELLPELSGSFRATGHPIFHLAPSDPDRYTAPRFPVFTADIARIGFYGFPLHRDGFVKIAHHGAGRPVEPGAPGEVTDEEEAGLRAFLSQALPSLADAPVVYSRICAYADTRDGDFWIARHPDRLGLIVAGGGSGHGFKFAPVLGGIIADAVEGRSNPWLDRFRWRPQAPAGRRDAARAARSLRDGPAPG